MTKKEKFECAMEVRRAHGDSPKCAQWFRKWMPEYMEKFGVITMQYSMSCLMVRNAIKLIEKE